MLLLWLSWTRSVWGHVSFLSNFTNSSVFETLYLWAAGVQLEGGRLWVGYWPLYSSYQSRSLQNTVEGYWQHLAKLWQNLGRQEEDDFTCDTSFKIFNLRILFWPGSSPQLISDYFFFFLIQALARIGANLCCLYGEVDEQKRFLSVITDAEWGIKLRKLEVCEENSFHI